MEHLPYDIVEEVVSYLPRSDVDTIAKVASRRPGLENWGAAAEDQLENRFLLDVGACVKASGTNCPSIRLIVRKCLPQEDHKPWNFTQWRYAWIRNLAIGTTTYRRPFQEVDIQRVLRVVSLPVDPSARGTLQFRHREDFPFLVFHSSGRESVNLSWKILQATQKGFVKVELCESGHEAPGAVEDFVATSINEGLFLEHLRLTGDSHCTAPQKISEAVTSVFGSNRTRPLALEFRSMCFGSSEIMAVIESWWNSAGTSEVMGLFWDDFDRTLWDAIKEKYNPTKAPDSTQYIVHPSRRSSILLFLKGIAIVRYQPWHVPVSFQWVDSVINKWQKGNGFYAFQGMREFSLSFKSEEDRLKFEEKHKPWTKKDDYSTLALTHPSKLLKLEVKKLNDMFEVRVQRQKFSTWELGSIISSWKKGNGDTLINGLTKIEVTAEPPRIRSFTHPNGTSRCVIVQAEYPDKNVERISITSIDPEAVKDWNLQLLFGSLRT